MELWSKGTAAGEWKLVTRPDPRPAPGQVLVRVRAVSLNYRDVLVARGLYGGKPTPGRIPCSDGAGEVVAVGDGVTRFKTGDRVASAFFQVWRDGPRTAYYPALGVPLDGMLAEYVTLDEDGVVALPASLSFEEAAALPCAGVTAWSALVDHGHLRAGETVVVQGTGPLGLFAVAVAATHSPRKLIAIGAPRNRIDCALALGADHAVDILEHPDSDVRVEMIRDLTAGRGADVVFEFTGSSLAMAEGIQLASRKGRYVMAGAVNTKPAPVSVETIIAKNGVAKARLTPIGPVKPARKLSGLLRVTYIADDFDAPDPELESLSEGEQ